MQDAVLHGRGVLLSGVCHGLLTCCTGDEWTLLLFLLRHRTQYSVSAWDSGTACRIQNTCQGARSLAGMASSSELTNFRAAHQIRCQRVQQHYTVRKKGGKKSSCRSFKMKHKEPDLHSILRVFDDFRKSSASRL